MRRFLLLTFLGLAAVLALAAGTAFYLLHDTAFLKTRIEALALRQAGRSLRIGGPLEVSPGRVTVVEAGDIHFASADWARAEDLVRVGRLHVAIDVPSLFTDRPRLAALHVEDCAIELERDAEGRGSWELADRAEAPESAEDEPLSPFVIADLAIARCRLELAAPDGAVTLDLRLDEARLGHTADERIAARVAGTVNDQPLSVDGWLGPAGILVSGGALQHELVIRAGPVELESSGSIADFRRLAGVALQARVHGPDIGEVLGVLQLPPLSDGPFDFRVQLDAQGDLTAIDVDGDLGSLAIFANGAVDRFVGPKQGRLDLRLAGPDLGALGEAFGVEALVREPFTASASAAIEDGVLRIDSARLGTTGDLVDLTGLVALRAGLADSELDLHLDSRELARWAELLHRGPGVAGAVALDSHLEIDAAGRLSIDARLRQGEAELRLKGPVGVPGEPVDARLDLAFSAPRPGPLLHWLAGRELPALPLEAAGKVRLRPLRLRFDGLRVASGPHELRVDGEIGLKARDAGKSVEVVFDSPDLAALGRELGRDDLPAGPLRVEGALRAEGRGLAFTVRDASLGPIRLAVSGRVPDRARPREVEGEFELQLPGPGPLHALWPWLRLPERPLDARGRLRLGPGGLRIDDGELGQDDITLRAEGSWAPPAAFDFRLAASGPDAAPLSGPARLELPPLPFRVGTRLSGDAQRLDIGEIDVALGDSRVSGELGWLHGAERRLEGRLHAALLDLTPFIARAEESAAPPPAKNRHVFDDTPVLQIADLGLAIEGDLAIDEFRLNTARATDVSAHLALEGRRLSIDRFSMTGITGGRLQGGAVLDGDRPVPELVVDLRGTGQRLAFGAYEGQDPLTLPQGDVTLALRGRGRTHHELAASLNGRLRMHFGRGEVAPASFAFLLSDFLTELIDALNPFTERSKVTRLDCLVVGADVADGRVTVDPVVVHAEKLTVVSQGTIDLESERLDLDFETRPRKGIGITASDLVNPFVKVGGTLAQPAMELDPAGTVVKGGLAVATAGLSILAKSLKDRYLSSKDPCGDALRALEERDAATP